jgi:thiamine biosynthesis lipoprotein
VQAIETRLEKYHRVEKLMGNRFEFSVISADEQLARFAIEKAIKEIKRIEALLTTFN